MEEANYRIAREQLLAAIIGKELAKRREHAARTARDEAERHLAEAARHSAAAATRFRVSREQVDKATPNEREAGYIVQDATERAEAYLRAV